MNRNSFLKIAGSGLLTAGAQAYGLEVLKNSKFKKLVVLHTNDWHSRIEPFPNDNSRNSNLGGASRRAMLIEKIKKEEENVLLLDAGDIFQGTPYFNYFGGELEFKLMSEMGYNAATMGNHDFDGGMDGFLKALKNAEFDFITTNYDFSDTILAGKSKKYKIIETDDLKIGIFSANIELNGLVPKKLFKETRFLDPLETSLQISGELKHKHNCDFIICLSHLGYKYDGEKVSDILLAENSFDIDLIIGGHTHTFMNKADIRKNKNDKEVIVTQAGWGGILLGRVDLMFDSRKRFLWSDTEFLR
jgi:5'-nucleotidase